VKGFSVKGFSAKNDTRPINVGMSDLLVFRFPIPAIASISHRIAGMALFVGIAFALYGLQLSLSSEQGFNQVTGAIGSPLGIVITIGLLAALAYHFVAGIKHLMMDFGVGETLEGGIFAAKLTFLLSAILIFLAAIWVLQ
jgi:succinate dehydrogenase / fumarate reductase, cytochrome b subunit